MIYVYHLWKIMYKLYYYIMYKLYIDLWQWYINTTMTILDINHHPVFYLKLNSTLYTLRLRYEPNRLMLSVGLWRRCINITVATLDIIHRPAFYLQHSFS
jgi:hypothetical protein